VTPPPIDLVDPAGSVDLAEKALHAEDRVRADLEGLGPGATILATAMDASVARVLTDYRAGLTAGTLRGQVAGLGPFAPEPGFNSWLVFGTLISTLDDFAREPRSGTFDSDPETLEIAGNTGTITTTLTVNATRSGSRLSVDLTMKTKGQVVDAATGAILYGIDSIVTGHIDIDFCPDASGRAAANVKLTSSEIYTSGGGTRGVSREFSGTAGIIVGEDAEIQTIEGTAQAGEEARGVAPAGGGDAATSSTRTASDNIATDRQGRRLSTVPRATTFGGEGSTLDAQVALWGSMTIFVETMVMAAAREAEKLWKDGSCVELIVDPEGGDVDPDSITDVVAKVRHVVEGNELDKPVTATLVGVKTVDPAGEKQPAPATVKYTAGSEEGETGDIAFESVSNRGIAKKTVRFTVGSTAWTVGFKGTTSQVANAALGPEKISLKATISDLRVTAKDGQLTGRGKLHLKGTHTAGCFTGKLDQVVPIDLEGSLIGTGPEAVLRVTFSRPSPSTGTIVLSCPQVASWPFPDAAYSEFFWFVIGTVDLPAAGGTVDFDRTVELLPRSGTATGTFTVTKVP
jgi:hypothetical protein